MNLDRLTTSSGPQRPTEAPIGASAATRRSAAIAAVAGYPVLVQLVNGVDLRPWVEGPVGGAVYGLAVVGTTVAWLLSCRLVRACRRSLAHAPDGAVDERGRRVLHEAHLLAYRLLLGAALVAAAVFAFVPSEQVSAELATRALSSFLVVGLVLPSAIVAWRDVDVEPDVGDAVAPARR